LAFKKSNQKAGVVNGNKPKLKRKNVLVGQIGFDSKKILKLTFHFFA